MGPVFRPKWHNSVYTSAIVFAITRITLQYNEDESNVTELISSATYSIGVSIMFATFSYMLRWILCRSFVL
jgi:hypothetical protein